MLQCYYVTLTLVSTCFVHRKVGKSQQICSNNTRLRDGALVYNGESDANLITYTQNEAYYVCDVPREVVHIYQEISSSEAKQQISDNNDMTMVQNETYTIANSKDVLAD